jgi:hypothetical protein
MRRQTPGTFPDSSGTMSNLFEVVDGIGERMLTKRLSNELLILQTLFAAALGPSSRSFKLLPVLAASDRVAGRRQRDETSRTAV